MYRTIIDFVTDDQPITVATFNLFILYLQVINNYVFFIFTDSGRVIRVG